MNSKQIRLEINKNEKIVAECNNELDKRQPPFLYDYTEIDRLIAMLDSAIMRLEFLYDMSQNGGVE